MNKMLMSSQMEKEFEWNKWIKEIPFLQFDPDWQVQIIPPTVGAVIRFRVKKNEKSVSIYLDCYDVLGFVGQPYWELYPDVEENNKRYFLNETEDLLADIRLSLDAQSAVSKGKF